MVGLEAWFVKNVNPMPTVQGVVPVCRRLTPLLPVVALP